MPKGNTIVDANASATSPEMKFEVSASELNGETSGTIQVLTDYNKREFRTFYPKTKVNLIDGLEEMLEQGIADVVGEVLERVISMSQHIDTTISNPVVLQQNGTETNLMMTQVSEESVVTAHGNEGSCYSVCDTGADDEKKIIICDGFDVKFGSRVTVKFTQGNSAKGIQFSVNYEDFVPVLYKGKPINGKLKAGVLYDFIYTGGQYEIVGELS